MHGMKMVWEMGVKQLLVESDCFLVVQWLRGSDETTPFLASLNYSGMQILDEKRLHH